VELMRKLLARRPGVELAVAETGQAAFAAIRTRRPDLVFLDLHLPDMTGEDVLHGLFEQPQTRTIPVAVLSADATESGRRRMLASGARTFLTKPLDVAEVLRLVDDVLGARRSTAS
jgi:CheY-like chemotaxis protein